MSAVEEITLLMNICVIRIAISWLFDIWGVRFLYAPFQIEHWLSLVASLFQPSRVKVFKVCFDNWMITLTWKDEVTNKIKWIIILPLFDQLIQFGLYVDPDWKVTVQVKIHTVQFFSISALCSRSTQPMTHFLYQFMPRRWRSESKTSCAFFTRNTAISRQSTGHAPNLR